MAPVNLDELNKLIATVLTLLALGGKWAVYGKELYDHVKSQTGMTDEDVSTRRDLQLDTNERKLLANLAAAGAGP